MVVLAEEPRGYDTTTPIAIGTAESFDDAMADARSELADIVVTWSLSHRRGFEPADQNTAVLFIKKKLELEHTRRAVMDGVTKELRQRSRTALSPDDVRFLEQQKAKSKPTKQLSDVEGVSLTAVIQGSRLRPTLSVEDTYEFEIPDRLLEQLTSDSEREQVLLAIDRGLPVYCIAVVDSTGTKLFELSRLFFPTATREALALRTEPLARKQRIAR